MTGDEIRDVVSRMRSDAEPYGPCHSFWDLIADAEALLRGDETILSQSEIVGLLGQYLDRKAAQEKP